MFEFVTKNATAVVLDSLIFPFLHFLYSNNTFDNFFFMIWSRMCTVPNACACMEIQAAVRMFCKRSFTHFFKHTAIILNTNTK